jgi:hypothetical protein
MSACVGHEIWSGKHYEGGTTGANVIDELLKLRGKERWGRSASGIIEAVADHKQVRQVGEDVLVEPLRCGWLAAVLIGRAPDGDHVGADAGIDQSHRPRLHIADERRQS